MAKTANAQELQMEKVKAFHQRVMNDVAGMVSVACGSIGDKLGLYKALAENGSMTPKDLAKLTGANERYLLEWLINQAASGYIEYDSASGRFTLPAEHALVLTNEDHPLFACGFFQVFSAFSRAVPRISECFQTGNGMPWGDHDADVFAGTERLFRPAYMTQLVPQWIPSIAGLKEKLESGAKVADIGCGHGLSTIIMAKSFPRSKFFGFDNHAPSIEWAKEESEREGVADRVQFQVSDAGQFPGEDYDLISYFDCLHDMGDPVASCRRAAQALKSNGCAMIIEPMAGNKIEENFNLVGRIYSGASIMCCTPNAVASGTHSLGTIATDRALEDVVKAGGFRHFQRSMETPFNRIFEARL